MTRTFTIIAVAAFALLSGCGTMTAVRPLRRGESAVAVSLGGPVANGGQCVRRWS